MMTRRLFCKCLYSLLFENVLSMLMLLAVVLVNILLDEYMMTMMMY